MKANHLLQLVIASIFLLAFSSANAQNVDEDESADVWAVVEEEWNVSAKRDQKALEKLLSDKVSVWENDTPAPRNKASIRLWNRIGERLGKSVAHELYPLSIIVHGDTAVAQYLFSSAFEDKDGKIQMNSGRYTDVLVRTDDGWKYLAWHGGED